MMTPSRNLISRAAGWLAAALLLAACAGAANDARTPTVPAASAPATAAPTAPPTPSPTAPAAAAATATSTAEAQATPGVSFQNPVIRQNFPDPFILPYEGRFYAYATNNFGRNVQVAVSDDLVEWEILTDAMPALPGWAAPRTELVWAPEVMRIGEQFVLYYTARDKASDRQCVGAAVSDRPEGKFKDTRGAPLVCQAEQGGTIDASPFQDGDRLYLYYKNDGNCCGQPTWLYAQELAPDGLSLVGEPTQLVRNDAVWEAHVIEAPSMVRHDDRYYLFFSANDYGNERYAVGYATCESATGPCADAAENPILKSLLKKPPVIGPGHQDIIEVNGQDWIVYHAWEVSRQGLRTDRRMMWLDRLDWEDGRPVVRGPTTGPQPVPLP